MAVIALFDIIKYAENNFQAFMPVKPLVLSFGHTIDHSMTGRRCYFDKVILTSLPPVILAYPTKFIADLSCADTFQSSKGMPCLGSAALATALLCLPFPPTPLPFSELAVGSQKCFWIWHSCASEGIPARSSCKAGHSQLPPPLQLPREARGPETDYRAQVRDF